MERHDKYMKRCYELAQEAQQQGESPVGSVLVKDGEIIGEGTEKSKQLKDITRHAEVVAIKDALRKINDLSEATLYTNVEPCLLCSYVIRQHRIKEVVFAKYCGELGGTQKPYNLLTISDIKVWSPPPKVTIFDKNPL